MAEWKQCKLSEIADIIMGQSPKSDYYNTEGKGIPFLQGNRTFGMKYPFFDTWTTKVTKEAQAGDVIMSVRAPVGALNIITENVCLGRGVCGLRMKNGRQDFLFYLMKFSMPQLLNKETGTIFGSVNRNDISNLTVLVPEDNVQDMVSHILKNIDDKIENNNKINRNLQEQATSIYKKMILDAPDECNEGVLSDIAEIIMGQSPKGDTYNEEGKGTVFYQGRAEFGDRFPNRRLFTTDPKRIAKENSVLVSVRAPVGDINVAYEECCIGRGLSSVVSKDNHQSFVLYTMFSLRDQFDVYNGEGTVFGSINKESMNGMAIHIPNENLMDEFEEIVSPMDAIIKANYEENYRLIAVRDALLPKLMSGELDILDLNI